jgi:acetyltransferase-like isoleucine patch superfamily enzyme
MTTGFLRPIRNFVRDILPPALVARIVSMGAPKFRRGRKVYIAPGVQFIGAANVKIGDNSCVSEQTWFNVNSRDTPHIGIDIGNHCFIGRRNFFSSGASITIGDYALTTIDCKFICSSHVIDDPLQPYISTGTTARDAIRVGTNCFFGAGAMVIGNVRIGHGSVIGAGAQVMRDVPPFSIVTGNPAKVVKRFSFVEKAWIDAASVSDEAMLAFPGEPEYLAALAAAPGIAMPLVAASAHFGGL